MDSWTSYPHIYALGHPYTDSIIGQHCYIQEKVDGSQFSFGITEDGTLRMKSRGVEYRHAIKDGMFLRAGQTAQDLQHVLTPGWTYRGEFLATPKHNVLKYKRTPKANVILYDINVGLERYLPYEQLEWEGNRIGLEVVPLLWDSVLVADKSVYETLLARSESILGGPIEGMVCKPVQPMYGPDNKAIMAKYVSDKFKEAHVKEWGKGQNNNAGILDLLASRYATPARWQKAVQHLREGGKLAGSPSDIGDIVHEVMADTALECHDGIAEELFKYYWQDISRRLTKGLPEWYKNRLVEEQQERVK